MSNARLKHIYAWLVATALVTGLLAAAVFHAGRFLAAPASAPTKADVLVVLGGDGGDRVLTAVLDYARGFGTYVLVTGLEGGPPQVRPAYLHWRIQFLLDAGVPRDRILFDVESSNSWEEAVNTRRLMEAKGWRRVLVISDPTHMRRLSWAWNKAFAGSGLEYSLVATTPASWKADEWWRDERNGAAVIMEYIKLAYYLVKY